MHWQLSIKQKTCFMNTLTFKMGVSDHHKLVGTMPRSTFTKGKPKKIFYGCYKNFDNEKYEEKLKFVFIFSPRFWIVPPCIKNDSRLTCTFKQKAMRNSNQSFMTKTLGKAIMKKSKWKNKFNKERNDKNWFNYKQERNHCSNPFYIYETKNSNNILNENYETMREDEKICKIFYTYFTNVTKGLKFR